MSLSGTSGMSAFDVQQWERHCALSAHEREAILQARELAGASHRPLPSHVVGERKEPEGSGGERGEIDSLEELYTWCDALAQQVEGQEESKWLGYLGLLEGFRSTCREMMKDVDAAAGVVERLRAEHAVVSSKTTSLHDACEEIVREQQRMQAFCDSLQEHLRHFECADSLSARLSSYSAHAIGVPDFGGLLTRLDESVAYIQDHPNYKSCQLQLPKFLQLRARALSLIKSHLTDGFKNAASSIQLEYASLPKPSSFSSSTPTTPTTLSPVSATSAASVSASPPLPEPSDHSSSLLGPDSLFFSRFRALAVKLRPLIERIEQRHHLSYYRDLLEDCHESYCYWRSQLLGPHVKALLDTSVASASGLGLALRACFHSIIELILQETQLFYEFFHQSTDTTELFQNGLMGYVGSSLLTTVRPLYIQSHRIDELVSVANLLKIEILEDRISRARYAPSVPFILPLASTMLADVQDRLIFLTQTYISDEIASFNPSPADLDYPSRLHHKTPASASSTETQLKAIMASWYPTLKRTLLLLSKLYLTLNPPIFEALAQEALRDCIWSISSASQQILCSGKPEVHVHAQLFYIQHLMILSEQIKPFDIEFQAFERRLDFAPVKASLNMLVSGGLRTFWDSLKVPLSPRTQESPSNPKRDLEAMVSNALAGLFSQHLDPITAPLAQVAAGIAQAQDSPDATAAQLPALLLQYETSIVQKIGPLRQLLLQYLAGLSPESLSLILAKLQACLLEPVNQLYQALESKQIDPDAIHLPSLNIAITKISAAQLPQDSLLTL